MQSTLDGKSGSNLTNSSTTVSGGCCLTIACKKVIPLNSSDDATRYDNVRRALGCCSASVEKVAQSLCSMTLRSRVRYESALPDSVCCCVVDDDGDEAFGLVMIINFELPIDDCNNDDRCGMMIDIDIV